MHCEILNFEKADDACITGNVSITKDGKSTSTPFVLTRDTDGTERVVIGPLSHELTRMARVLRSNAAVDHIFANPDIKQLWGQMHG